MRPAPVKPKPFRHCKDEAKVAVVLVAHGSRDPRAAQATEALAAAVRAGHPEWDVRASYLDHSMPRPRQVLASFDATGHQRAVMVPLLLTAAYHGRVDVPGEINAARAEGVRLDVALADVLGPVGGRVPELLLDGLESRLRSADAGDLVDGVVLAAAGTRDAAARGTVELTAAALSARLGVPCRVAYASAAPPLAGDAVRDLVGSGCRRVGLASYFLAPGLLWDSAVASAREAGVRVVAEPLTDGAAVAELVAARVVAAARTEAAYAA
ncbi:cobalamin biosynthesis protein CbiX [Couchioplanes caeruleus]|uniref:sirohydrochlorin chelatase n=1 Tax=Couchioplanes caeruleus TaxID=56438 RepID=UPI0020C1650D|nr:CbiX/SirB N-terminal domain-containing protein [Couchioplanes caeruleus]UQU65955.1 cobalamin biosynthesis protein CbiX [Couchioplanes caeruleus]